MCGEDAIDDKVGRRVNEDEQVRDRVQRDEVEWGAIVAARAHAVPYVVGTKKGLENNKKYISHRIDVSEHLQHLHCENKPRHVRHDEDGANGDEDDRVVCFAVVVTAVNVGAGTDDGSERTKK